MDILGLLSQGNYIVAHKTLIKLYGTDVAVLVGHFASMQQLYGEWFFHTSEQIEAQTGIKIYSSRKALKLMEDEGILYTKKQGMPYKLYYKLDEEKLISLFLKNPKQVLRNLKTSTLKSKNKPLENSKHNKNIVNKNIEDKNINLNIIPCDLSQGTTFKRTKPSKLNSKLVDNPNQNKQPSKTNNKQTPPKQKEYIQFKPFAKQLAEIVQEKKNINITGTKIVAWTKSIEKLCRIDGIKEERLQTVLDWYKDNYGNDYVPVVESGQTLREKFTRLEDAIKRQKKPIKKDKHKGVSYGTRQFGQKIDYSQIKATVHENKW